ncbi:MAG: DUF2252 domain-containing protein, partial [Actinobacteria bacterium]|nr:DUF2252 domain-containing protein [Actinomycetota bacterium]
MGARRTGRSAAVDSLRVPCGSVSVDVVGSGLVRGDHAALLHGLHEEPVVTFVAVGVAEGELAERPFEGVLAAQVGRECHPVARPGVCPRERPAAQPGVGGHPARHHLLDVDRALPVTQLAHVVVDPVAAVTAARPAQEDVAAGLHESLAEHYTLVGVAHKVVGVGSVGTRAWILLLLGKDAGEPLFLQ